MVAITTHYAESTGEEWFHVHSLEVYFRGTVTFVVVLVAEEKENAANYCKAYQCVD